MGKFKGMAFGSGYCVCLSGIERGCIYGLRQWGEGLHSKAFMGMASFRATYVYC